MVRLAPPPPQGRLQPRHHTVPAGSELLRVYNPQRHNTQPLTLRMVGPIERFDHHRRIPPAILLDPVRDLFIDPERGVSYAAMLLSCCLVEVFGEMLSIELDPWEAAVLRPTRPLHLLDLRGAGAMGAGSVAALAKVPDRPLTQEWSRWFYEHEADYQHVDGLFFFGAHNDEESLVLFERCGAALACDSTEVWKLSDTRLRPIIDATALAHGMSIA